MDENSCDRVRRLDVQVTFYSDSIPPEVQGGFNAGDRGAHPERPVRSGATRSNGKGSRFAYSRFENAHAAAVFSFVGSIFPDQGRVSVLDARDHHRDLQGYRV